MSVSNKTAQVWDSATGNRIIEYTGHSDNVNSVAWSPDGKYIASGSTDMTVQVWVAPLSSPTYMMAPAVSSAKVLSGKFKIVQELADTGSGRVYKVEQISTPYFYAVKELLIDPAISEEDQKTLTKHVNEEVELLSGLKHPHISSFISSFQEHGNYYFVMEFVPGRNLESILYNTKGPLEEVQVIKWMMSICDALTYIHSYMPPIILEKMRSSDIMVTPEGDVRLIDMGTWRRHNRPYWPREKRTPRGGVRLPADLPYWPPENLMEFDRSSTTVTLRAKKW